MTATEPTVWHGCYDGGWKGVITPDSFAHPAKFSRNLIERIFKHSITQGYLGKGDLCGDPFGGVGVGGITAAYAGLRWIGVELEPRFVAMAESNFALHRAGWVTMGLPAPTIIQGDSRKFEELVGQVAGVVCSPPFQDRIPGSKGFHAPHDSSGHLRNGEYGTTAGQIGNLKSGSLDAVVTSPPYSDIAAGAGGLNTKPASKPGQQSGRSPASASQTGNWSKEIQRYGKTDGQIARLKDGSLDAVVTSSPYGTAVIHGGHGLSMEKFKDPKRVGVTSHAIGKNEMQRYGQADGNIGNGSGTYWSAMRDVYLACHRAIRPGGVLVCVMKDYVKSGKRVPLCDDTAKLLEFCGFTIIERIHAMLVKETRHGDLFDGERVSKSERKSFFRRLAEKKGSPPIDFEEVIIARQ